MKPLSPLPFRAECGRCYDRAWEFWQQERRRWVCAHGWRWFVFLESMHAVRAFQ